MHRRRGCEVRRPGSSFQARIGNTPSRGGFIWLETRAGRNRGWLSTVPPFRRTRVPQPSGPLRPPALEQINPPALLDASSAQRAHSVTDGHPGPRLVLHAGKNCPSGSTAVRRWSRIFNVMQTLGLHVSGETFIQVAVGGWSCSLACCSCPERCPRSWSCPGPGSRHPVQCDSVLSGLRGANRASADLRSHARPACPTARAFSWRRWWTRSHPSRTARGRGRGPEAS
jgi:hypothetical protein